MDEYLTMSDLFKQVSIENLRKNHDDIVENMDSNAILDDLIYWNLLTPDKVQMYSTICTPFKNWERKARNIWLLNTIFQGTRSDLEVVQILFDSFNATHQFDVAKMLT